MSARGKQARNQRVDTNVASYLAELSDPSNYPVEVADSALIFAVRYDFLDQAVVWAAVKRLCMAYGARHSKCGQAGEFPSNDLPQLLRQHLQLGSVRTASRWLGKAIACGWVRTYRHDGVWRYEAASTERMLEDVAVLAKKFYKYTHEYRQHSAIDPLREVAESAVLEGELASCAPSERASLQRLLLQALEREKMLARHDLLSAKHLKEIDKNIRGAEQVVVGVELTQGTTPDSTALNPYRLLRDANALTMRWDQFYGPTRGRTAAMFTSAVTVSRSGSAEARSTQAGLLNIDRLTHQRHTKAATESGVLKVTPRGLHANFRDCFTGDVSAKDANSIVRDALNYAKYGNLRPDRHYGRMHYLRGVGEHVLTFQCGNKYEYNTPIKIVACKRSVENCLKVLHRMSGGDEFARDEALPLTYESLKQPHKKGVYLSEQNREQLQDAALADAANFFAGVFETNLTESDVQEFIAKRLRDRGFFDFRYVQLVETAPRQSNGKTVFAAPKSMLDPPRFPRV